jgi:hypothetical protein
MNDERQAISEEDGLVKESLLNERQPLNERESPAVSHSSSSADASSFFSVS